MSISLFLFQGRLYFIASSRVVLFFKKFLTVLTIRCGPNGKYFQEKYREIMYFIKSIIISCTPKGKKNPPAIKPYVIDDRKHFR